MTTHALRRVPARVYLQGSNSHLMTVVAGGYPEVERHDAIIILARANSTFTLRQRGVACDYDAVAVAPLALHGVESAGGFALIALHLWHPLFKAVRSFTQEPVVRLPRAAFSRLDAQLDAAIDQGLDADAASDLVDEAIDTVLDGVARPAHLDPRVLAAMRALDENIETPFDMIGQRLGISNSRLSHLFTSELGVTYRGFIAWLRLRIAWELVVLHPEVGVGDIAAKMGYADTGHFSRSFRKTFGITPTAMRDTRREIIGYPMPPGRRATAGRVEKWGAFDSPASAPRDKTPL